MNCPNCGAPLTLHATRPCWQCAHCQTMICPEPVEDGVRLTGEAGHRCPVCRIAMTRAVMDDRHRIEVCERCKGIFMPLSVFAITLTGRRRKADTPSVTPSPADRRDLDRRIACPGCGAEMITDWYYAPGNMVIDTCTACNAVWLDTGELRRAVDAPGPDRRA